MLKITRDRSDVQLSFTDKYGRTHVFTNSGGWFSRLIESRLEDRGYEEVNAYVNWISGDRHFYVYVKGFEKDYFNERLDQLMDASDRGVITYEQTTELLDKAKELLATILEEVEDACDKFTVEYEEDFDDDPIDLGFSVAVTNEAGQLKFHLEEESYCSFWAFLNQAVGRLGENISVRAIDGGVHTETPAGSFTHKKMYEAYMASVHTFTSESLDELVEEIKFYLQDIYLDAQEQTDD
jgi:hypothetical protein